MCEHDRMGWSVFGNHSSGVYRSVSEFRPDWRWRRARRWNLAK